MRGTDARRCKRFPAFALAPTNRAAARDKSTRFRRACDRRSEAPRLPYGRFLPNLGPSSFGGGPSFKLGGRGVRENVGRNSQILEAYRSGEPAEDIGRRFGVTGSRIRKIAKRYGVHRDRINAADSELIEKARRLFLKGMRLSHVASEVGLNRTTLRCHLQRSGDLIPGRGSGAWEPEIYETALRLRSEGKSATQIAAVVGKSRSAVIGKLWRASL